MTDQHATRGQPLYTQSRFCPSSTTRTAKLRPVGFPGGLQFEGSSRPLEITLIVITRGRAPILRQVLGFINAQTRRPDHIIVSAVGLNDTEGVKPNGRLSIIYGNAGACRQRNEALRHLSPTTDIVIFFDDDFVAHPRWIEAVERCFKDRPGVVGVTGYLLADGVRRGGLSIKDALSKLSAYTGEFSSAIEERYSPYGCNMAFRRTAMDGLWFDERLVLYGWLEDRDFGAALRKKGGKLIKFGGAIGVHLGANSGRMSGRRLGYSQIVNPFYLLRKKHMTGLELLDHVARNLTMNAIRSFHPERHIDRPGRLLGNLQGFLDLLRGVLEPERAELLG